MPTKKNYDLDLNVRKSETDGFALVNTLRQQVYQKFKTLLLTRPGERIGHGTMGVGLQNFLFAGNVGDANVYSTITNTITNQVAEWMPYVRVEDIRFNTVAENPNLVYMRIIFSVDILGITDAVFVAETTESGTSNIYFDKGFAWDATNQ